MPTIIERVQVSVDRGALDQALGGQLSALTTAISLVEQLLQGKTPGLKELIDSIGALRLPFADVSDGGFVAAIQGAQNKLPTDLTQLVAPVTGRIGEMETLINDQVRPLLGDAVKVASALQHFMSLRLSCPTGIAGNQAAAPPVVPAAEPPAGPPSGDPPPSRANQAAQQLEQFESVLAMVPAPIDAGTLLQLLLTFLSSKPRDRFFQINLPVIDDLFEPLQTLALWASLDADGVRAHLTASLTALRDRLGEVATAPLASLASTMNGLVPQLNVGALTSAVDAVLSALTDLCVAIESNNDAAIDAATGQLTTAIDTYEGLRVTLAGAALPQLQGLISSTGEFPRQSLEALQHLAILLEPSHFVARVTQVIPGFAPVSAEAVAAVQEAMAPFTDWLKELVAQLDFSSIQDSLAGVTATAQQIADGIESSLGAVTLQIQSAFGQASEAIASVGLTNLSNSLSAEIQQFGGQTQRELANAFAPAKQGISAAISAIDAALDAFDLAALEEALQQVFDSIAAVLGGGDVQAAIGEIKGAIDSVTEALRSLSFAPVTDEVIALIDTMKKGLEAALSESGSDAIKAAVTEAMAFLPNDLQPATDPIIADFGVLVESGPVALLTRVQDVPKQLLDEIKAFEPASLLGDSLDKPFSQLLGKAEGFDLNQLLAPVDTALNQTKQRIRQTASAAKALQGLTAPVNALTGKLDAFSAQQLLKPIEDSIEGAVNRIIDASPVDEAFAVVNGVFATLQDALGFVERIGSLASRIQALFDAFTQSEQQLNAWRDGIVAKISAAANGPLAQVLDEIAIGLSALNHNQVTNSLTGALASMDGALTQLDPQVRSTQWLTLRGKTLGKANGLADATRRNAVLTALNRIDPAALALLAPLRLAGDLQTAITTARTQFAAQFDTWQASVDGFAEMQSIALSDLATAVAELIDQVLQPVRWLFATLGNLAAPVAAVTTTLSSLVTELTTRIGGLITGPASLSAISNAMQSIVEVLRNIDVGFLGAGVDAVIGAVRDQLRALDPTQLAAELDRQLDALLDTINLNVVVSESELAALSQSYGALLTKLQGLNPSSLVKDRIQPLFDQTIDPLLDAFDLSALFAALIEFLNSLDDQLKTELGRVNTAYQSLISLRSSGSGVSVSIGG